VKARGALMLLALAEHVERSGHRVKKVPES